MTATVREVRRGHGRRGTRVKPVERRAALLGDDPHRLERRSAPGVVGQPWPCTVTTASAELRGRGHGCHRRGPRPRPMREAGHHIRPPENVQHDQVAGVEFQAAYIDARFRIRVTWPPQFGDHLRVQAGGEVADAVGGGQDCCSLVDVRRVAESLKPGALASSGRSSSSMVCRRRIGARSPRRRFVSRAASLRTAGLVLDQPPPRGALSRSAETPRRLAESPPSRSIRAQRRQPGR